MNRVLVTGGAGFIGSHLCESLVADGHRVVCLDNFGSGRRRNIDDTVSNVQIVEGDVTDDPAATLANAGVDLDSLDRVFHLASRASPQAFESHPLEIAMTNSVGTRQILDLAAHAGARVVYTSTSEVYGDPEIHPQGESYNGNVNPRGPRACYDESKRFGETLAAIYGRHEGLDVRTARVFNTYGPRMRPDDGRVIPTFLTQALSGRDLTVYGDGSQTRSFLYVTDLIEGLRALMDYSGIEGDVVNLGSTDERTILELAEAVLDVVETNSGIVHEPLPTDDPTRRRPDVERAETLLDWSQTTSFTDGVTITRNYFATLRQ